MNGGEKFSEGGYGCVYYPSIKCNGEESKDKRHISKIQSDNYAGRNEIDIGNIIKKIPYYKDFFIPVISHCKVNSTLLRNGNIDTCKPIRNKKNKDIIIMKMDYVKGNMLNLYLASINSPRKLIHQLIYTYNYLIESTALLLSRGIVHYDLKTVNIMFDTNKNIPYIIDFGLSFKINDLNHGEKLRDIFYVYAPDYYIWCPEIHILSYILSMREGEVFDENTIEDICDTIIDENRVLHKAFKKEDIKKYKTQLRRFYLKKYKSFNGSIIKLTKYLLKTYSTWDNYSISIMYLHILSSFDVNDIKREHLYVSLFTNMLLKGIHYDPDKRIDLMKLDEYLLVNMYSAPDIHNKDVDVTEKYIKTFIDFLKDVNKGHQDIKKSMRDGVKDIINVSKSIVRPT